MKKILFTSLAFAIFVSSIFSFQVFAKEESAILVNEILKSDEVKILTESSEISTENVQFTEIHGTNQKALIFPIEGKDHDPYSNVQFLVVTYNDDQTITDYSVLSIKKVVSNDDVSTTISFSDIDGNNKKAGIYKNGELSAVQVDEKIYEINSDEITLNNALIDCLIAAFDSLPWFIKAACAGACGAVFTGNPLAIAACAGCIVASGGNHNCF
ncbi:hypothetical protein [Caldalkalibacillus mannanilyticus]|uniref:hypothetical protein n=1 Tax=Caldalkalibacillus mannanilyticus TaxID=1418 RepID=UPI00046A7C5E|nr:hypothetical protein [Caldalkalibacillus mannanilyticus]